MFCIYILSMRLQFLWLLIDRPIEWLTPCCRIFLEQLIVIHLVQESPAVKELGSSLSCSQITSTVHILSHLNPVKTFTPLFSDTLYVIIWFSHLSLGLINGLFPWRFPAKTFLCISQLSHACYMFRPSHTPWFDHSYNNQWRMQMMTFLIDSYIRQVLANYGPRKDSFRHATMIRYS